MSPPGERLISAPLVSPAEARSVRNAARRTAKDEDPPWFGSPSTAITPEIQQLSRGLRRDPRLLYEYVRNFVEYVPMYGSVKGATMTLLDGEGTDFDQTSLLIALMRESGFTNCAYVYGTIQLNAEQTTNWLGIANKAAVLEELLGSGGIPAVVTPAGEAIDHVVMDHVWAKVEIGGTNYVFDPSFKQHRVIQGVDVASAMGYDRNAFISDATQGMLTGPAYVQNMNRTNLRADLSAYSSNLVAWLSSNRPAASLSEVIGGREVEPVTGLPFQTALPYELTRDEEFADIPEEYETWIGIGFQSSRNFTVSQVYGKRLCMVYAYDRGGLPRQYWILDGERFDDFYDHGMPIILNIDHPYAANGGKYADEEKEFPRKRLIEPDDYHLYYVSTGWGSRGRRIVEKHRDILAQMIANSPSTNREPVLGESLTLIGLTWMAECSRGEDLVNRLLGTMVLRHHEIGVVGQEEFPMMDMLGRSSVVSRTGHTNTAVTVFNASGQWSSAVEWGALDQMQPGSAVSTVKLFDLANVQSSRIFNADRTNYTSEVRPNLVAYSDGVLETLDRYITNGWRLVLPEHGDLRDGSYVGAAFYALHPDGAMGSFISGGLNGGYGTERAVANPAYSAEQMRPVQNADDHPQSAEPVDLLTGHYLDRQVDLTVGSGGLPFGLAFARSYNSGRHHTDGPLGRGWSHSLDITAGVNSDAFRGLGSLAGAEAAEAIAAFYVSVDLLRDGPAMDRLVMTTLAQRWLMGNLISNVVNVVAGEDAAQFLKRWDGSYTPTPGKWAQLEQEADTSFRLIAKHGVQFDFDTAGKLSTWRDPNDNIVSFSYADGLLTLVTNHLGRSLHLTYDTNRHLAQVADHTGRKVTYAYDGDKNLTNQVDPLGNASRYEYDVPGRLTRVFHPSDPVTPFVVNEYAEGYVLHEFDPQGEGEVVEFKVYLPQVVRQTLFNGQSHTYFYAASRSSLEVDPEGNTRTWEFDNAGQVVRFVDPLGEVRRFHYDGVARLVGFTLPEGNGQQAVFDGQDNITETRILPKAGSTSAPIVLRFTYVPTHNRLSRSTDPLGRETDYTHDGRGNLTRMELPEVNGSRPTFEITVNHRGQVTEVSGPEGLGYASTFDPVTGDLVSGTVDPDGLNIETTLSYDLVGNLTMFTDPRSNTLKFEYNARGQIVKLTDPAPFAYETRLDYDASGNVVRLQRQTGKPAHPWQELTAEYNLGHQPTRATDPMGRITSFLYSDRQALWKTVSPAGQVTGYGYDTVGRANTRTDPLGNVVETVTYSANGRVDSVRDGNTNVTKFLYDDFDRARKTIYADGSFEELAYDGAGNVVQYRNRKGDTRTYAYDTLNRSISRTLGAETTWYGYDALSRVCSVSNASGSVTFQYDAASRVTNVTDTAGRTVHYAYDASGNRTGLTYPDGFALTYTYDELNRLSEIRESGGAPLAQYTYDALSRCTRLLYGNDVASDCAYQPDDTVSAISNHFTSGTVSFNYSRNNLGLISSVKASDPAFRYRPPVTTNVSYAVNPLNQYGAVAGQTWTYDDGGNLSGDERFRYEYDAAGRLATATGATHAVTCSYDPLGRRVRKTTDGEARAFVYDQWHVLAEYDTGANVIKRYVYGAGLDELVLMQTSSNRYYYHQDAGRSVVALSDASGNIVETYAYGPFGEPLRVSGVGNSKLFTGAEYDAETGLYYFRARYYSPSSGRFVSPDPIAYAGDGLNLYAYARNNPLAYRDPLGLASSWWNWSSQLGGNNNYLDSLALDYAKAGKVREAGELCLLNQALQEYGEARDKAEEDMWNQPDCVSVYGYLKEDEYRAIFDAVNPKLSNWKVVEVTIGRTDSQGLYHATHQAIGTVDTQTGKVMSVYDPVVTHSLGQWPWKRYGPAAYTSAWDWYKHNSSAGKGSEFVVYDNGRAVNYEINLIDYNTR